VVKSWPGARRAAGRVHAYLPETQFLSPDEALARFEKKTRSIRCTAAGQTADAFNVANKVYAARNGGRIHDGSLSKEALGKQ